MSKIYFQGTFGAYSHLAALSIDPKAEVVPCKTFDDCFVQASKDTNSKIVIPVGNTKSQQLHVITKLDAEEIKEDIFEEVAFVPMLSGTSIDGNDS